MRRKNILLLLTAMFLLLCLAGCFGRKGASSGATAAAPVPKGVFAGYEAVLVENFEVPSNVAAPSDSGSQLANKIVFQIRRYSQKANLFSVIDTIEKKKAAAGKKTILIKGDVKEYTQPTIGRQIGRSFIPGGEFTGTAAFAAHYRFLDNATGKVLYETDLRTTSTGSADTVDYAMERNAEAAAKVVYQQKQ